MLNESPFYYNYIQNNFSNYVEATESWLSINREFVTSNVEQEMSMNMPFMTTNESEDNKAILLVHGLNDSPFTFRDIAQDLAKHGFHVQVILLPGHGSKPQDMFLPQLNDWESLVSHYAQILQNNYSEVWLGGFSTGANLVTSYAILNEGISGLMLFSPAFLSKSPLLEHMTQYIPSKIDIVDYEKQRNLAKYDSAPFNGLKVYSGSAIKVRQLLSFIHRKQKDIKRESGSYSSSKTDLLETKTFNVGRPIVWEVEGNSYRYHAIMQHPFNAAFLWHMDETGRLWKEFK